MKYKIVKQSSDDLDITIKEKLTFWAKPDFCKVFQDRDRVSLYYLCVIADDQVIATMPIFEKQKLGIKYLHQLEDFFYTPIDIFTDRERSPFYIQNETLEIYKAIGIYLKKHYFKVILNFEDNITDIRGFKWAGLYAEPFYKYTINLKNYDIYNLSASMRWQIRKPQKMGIYIKEGWNLSVCPEISKNLALRKKRSLRQTSQDYMDFLSALNEQNLTTQITVFHDDIPLAYSIMLKDHSKGVIYLLVTASSDMGNKLRVNEFMYDKMFHLFPDYDKIDIGGANTETVSYFKSKFNPDLENYFRISKKYLT